ncbi:MAG: SPOR domain-containing protein [Desulfohalobiaceae bacterium]|nr:SPOR domain-containing protein [Desulfohalobiaceae bacterium]
MAASKKKKSTAKKKGSKKIQFSLSWPGLVTVCSLGCLALIWVFILGVIVGRGYHPENLLPKIAAWIPGYSVEEKKALAEENSHQVLEPEDLNFFEDMKKKVQVRLDSRESSSSGEVRETQSSPGPLNAERQGERYQCVYQVAAFKTRQQADRVVSGLRRNDIQASVHEFQKPDQNWFRVYVDFTGSAQGIRILENKLNSLGLKNHFLRSKKPK